ncbi:hypothetical protein ABZ953_03405 [Streptomyces sp. NPDC046465]
MYIAAAPDRTLHLRESDDHPAAILTTGPRQLNALLTAIRTYGR